MKSRHLHLWLGGAGAFFLTPGLLWIAISGSRLKVDDAYIALQPLARIPLRRISDSNLRELLTSRHEPARPQRAVTRQIAPAYLDKKLCPLARNRHHSRRHSSLGRATRR